MKKKKEDNKLIYAILIIFIMFVFIIIAEVILVKKYINRDKSYEQNLFSSKTNDLYYNTSDLANLNSLPNPNKKYIRDICIDKCNMYINGYYYILDFKEEKYVLNIVKDNKLIFTKSLGKKIDNAYVTMYDNNIVFYGILSSDSFVYDYAVLVNEKGNIDEFSSLESNEMEFTNDGIIYYSYTCNKNNNESNAYKIKYLRKPFSKNPKEQEKYNKDYTWCINQ